MTENNQKTTSTTVSIATKWALWAGGLYFLVVIGGITQTLTKKGSDLSQIWIANLTAGIMSGVFLGVIIFVVVWTVISLFRLATKK